MELRQAKRSPRNLWTEAEDSIIRQFYALKQHPQMMKLLPKRGRTDISNRASKLGVQKAKVYKKIGSTISKLFTKEMDKTIVDLYPTTLTADICKVLPGNLTVTQVSKRANYLGAVKLILKKADHSHDPAYWTENETKILKDAYPTKQLWEIRKLLPNKRDNSIHTKARHLNLVKVPGFRRGWDPVKQKIRAKEAYAKAKNKEVTRKEDKVLSTKTDHYTGNKIRVNATTEIYAKPGKTPEQVINEYNAARQAAKQRLLKGPSKWD